MVLTKRFAIVFCMLLLTVAALAVVMEGPSGASRHNRTQRLLIVPWHRDQRRAKGSP